MQEIDLKTAGAEARAGVLRLNAAVEEKTSVLDAAGLDRLLAASAFAPAILDDAGQVLAFLIGFVPGADYASPNYRWFCDRLARFAYVDRVVVAEAARGRGLARQLYDRFAAFAVTDGLGPVVCEVNLDPPNPGSDAFHAAMGFVEMGRGAPSPGKVVRYLVGPVPSGG
jgi:predicted GNAT superfamily acetyltransferase